MPVLFLAPKVAPRVLFIKAIKRGDDRTMDWLSSPSQTHTEVRTRKDGVSQIYHVGNPEPVKAKPIAKPEVKPHEYRYALRNRPFGIGTAPKDGWVRTEPRPAEGADHYGLARHGFAIYSRPLTDQEIRSFELTPMVDVDEHAKRLVAKMGEYAQQYAEPENAELLAEFVTQNARSVGVASTDDMTALQQRVLAQIGQAAPAKTEAPPFTPTHELSDGTPVRATAEKGVYTDASGAEIEDDYAKPIKASKQEPVKPAADKPKQEGHSRAPAGGGLGANGEWYEGGKFINTVPENAKGKAKANKATGKQEIEPRVWAVAPEEGMRSIWARWGSIWGKNRDGNLYVRRDLSPEYAPPQILELAQQDLDRYNAGERWYRPGAEANTKPVEEATPQEGDTKTENGISYVLKDGRWHRTTKTPTKPKTKSNPTHYRVNITSPFGEFQVYVAADKDAIPSDYLKDAKTAFLHDSGGGTGFTSSAQVKVVGDPVPVTAVPAEASAAKNAEWARIAKVVKPEQVEETGLRYDPATNRHGGMKLVRGDVLQGVDGKRYTLDRDMGFSLQVDALGPDGRIVPASTRTISVDPSDRDRFLEVSLTGENLFDAQEVKAPVVPDKAPIPEAPADDLDPSSPNYRYRDTGYVGGSRKELAAALLRTAKRTGAQVRKNDIDWETLETNPREAKEVITKSHLFGTVDWDGLKAQGLTPGAGFVMDRVYASVGTGPRDDTPQARQDYALGLETLRNRLEACRTPEDIEKTLAEIKEERDGVNLNSEETARYQELEQQAEAAYAPVHAYKKQEYELDKAVTIAHRVFYAAESPAGHRRGGKYTADQQADIDRARAGLEAAQKAKQALVDANPDMQEETITVKTPKGSMTTWTRPAEKEWRRIRQQQDILVAVAKARNQVESPLLRAWSQLGERFNAVLDYRSGRGSETFHNHLATAKLGRIKDWSWQKTDQTKAPRQVTQEGRRFQLQVADSHERVGGRSVAVASTADLKERFHLREVQSGNWVLRDPVSAKFHTEQTAGALSDLADILGVSDQQVAMNGRVALAFGARGTGNAGGMAARAHYEPVQRVINMTKLGGGGCLAHEWLHALDNLLLESQGGDAKAEDFLTDDPSLLPPGPLRNAFQGLRDAFTMGQHRIRQRLIYTPEHYRLAQQNVTRNHLPEAMRERGMPNAARIIKDARDVSMALDKLDMLYAPLIEGGRRGAKKHLEDWRNVALAYHGGQPEGGSLVVETGKPQSSFAMEAQKLDNGAIGKYWSKPHELAARAFQSYVEDKLASQGRRNDYLSAKADNKYYRLDGVAPFPEGEERTRINAAFDKLIAAMQADNSLAKALQPRVLFFREVRHGL